MLAIPVLYLISIYNFLLFHSLVEIFSIVVAFGIFVLAWNARKITDNNYLLFIGIAFLFIGFLDLIHTLAYKGMGVFSIGGGNLSTQLWIATRYTHSISFLIAPFFIGRKLRANSVFLNYVVLISLLLGSIFYWNIFPVCFIEAGGLTPFKKISEYIIALIFLAAIVLLYRKRHEFDQGVLQLLIISIFMTIGSELAFTFYISVYGLSNTMGHFLKVAAFYFIYKAIIETCFKHPYLLIFRNLRQSQEELRRTKEAAEAASRSKSDFLANMSHELRTPLNAIIGFSEILSNKTFGQLNQRQERYVENILSSGRHLLQLINDILDLSKVEAGKMELEPARVYLKGLLENSLAIIKGQAMKHGVGLDLNAPAELEGLEITGDERKLKQIIFNLLSNAVKFTPENGNVRVSARIVDCRLLIDDLKEADINQQSSIPGPDLAYRRKDKEKQNHKAAEKMENSHYVCARAGINHQCIEISVADSGIGIKPEDQEKVFGEFEQIASPHTREQEGTGLGLAVTKKLVELHGGRIRVESEGIGKGSTFIFVIPLKIDEVKPVDIKPENITKEPVKAGAADGPLVLIVEDDRAASELLTQYLSEAGYAVAHAFDGKQAIQMARELKPFAITLDIILPKKDGWEVLSELKSHPETREIPVIVVSITKDRELGFGLGAIEWFVKPVDKGQLLNAVRDIVPGKEFKTVLVVDDEPETVELLTGMLRSGGHNILQAYSGQQGIDMAIEKQPDILILDLMMPEITGFDVVQQLRDHAEARNIPVFIYTAKDLTIEDRQRLNSHVQATVSKSMSKKELQEELGKLAKRTNAKQIRIANTRLP